MKTIPALFYTCLLVFQVLLPARPASGAEESLELYPVQLGPGVWYLLGEFGMATAANRGFMSNAGIVVGAEGIAVFDTLATPAHTSVGDGGDHSQGHRSANRIIFASRPPAPAHVTPLLPACPPACLWCVCVSVCMFACFSRALY